jgi:hypothetical protein
MAYGIVIQQKVIDAMTMRRPTQFGSIVLHMEPHELRTELKRRINSILTINWMSTKRFIHGLMVHASAVCPLKKKKKNSMSTKQHE